MVGLVRVVYKAGGVLPDVSPFEPYSPAERFAETRDVVWTSGGLLPSNHVVRTRPTMQLLCDLVRKARSSAHALKCGMSFVLVLLLSAIAEWLYRALPGKLHRTRSSGARAAVRWRRRRCRSEQGKCT